MRWLGIIALTSALSASTTTLVFRIEPSSAAVMEYNGDWTSKAIYPAGSVAQYAGILYLSLKSSAAAPNRNRVPDTATDYWKALGTNNLSVVDANGKRIGTVLDADTMWFSTPNGQIVLRCPTAIGFCYPGRMYYESANCSGQAYMNRPNDNDDIGLLSVGAVRKANRALDVGNASVAGTLYYPIEPFSVRQIRSFIDSDGLCNGTSESKWVGPVATMPVSWKYPIKVKQ